MHVALLVHYSFPYRWATALVEAVPQCGSISLTGDFNLINNPQVHFQMWDLRRNKLVSSGIG